MSAACATAPSGTQVDPLALAVVLAVPFAEAPSAAPSEGADTRGAIGAWSPTGAPKLNGAPTAARSEAGADVGGTADGLTIPMRRTAVASALGRRMTLTRPLAPPELT